MKLTNAKKRVGIFALAMVAPLLTSQANAQNANFDAYYNSKFGYCDAKKIAHVWRINIGDAKAKIGAFLRDGKRKKVRQDIRSTRNSVRCSFRESGIQWNELQKLARYWGRNIGDAKTKVEDMVSKWGTRRFRNKMRDALS